MEYCINRDNLNNIAYVKELNDFIKYDNEHESKYFREPAGIEHYNLLSFLSDCFNDGTIIDIGAYQGYSTLALSYNKTNTVYTFDIKNTIINDNIKNKDNIKITNDNIFENNVQLKWKDKILESKLIFLDIDPHDGIAELTFLNFLKKINYNGIVLCDDIYLNSNMSNKFWKCIPNNCKYDLTQFGHWSGTGLITYNKDITLTGF